MKLNLNYSPKRTITTADLYNSCDPPLVFEVMVRPPREWAVLYNTFEQDGARNIVMAIELISLAFLTISDGENTYPFDTVEAVEAIREDNPYFDDTFFCNTAWSFGRHYYSFLRDHLGNSLEPLPQLNGSSGEKAQALAS